MPVERRFTAGSIIYFDHEVGDSIYVLKSGRVDISFIQPESGEKIVKTLTIGEFFGLKSAIINHTRDEIAEAVTDVLTIEFKVNEFEAYVGTNVELLKRLLRVLSNQLRNLGIKVNNYLGNNVIYPPNIGLFKIGEYYLNNKQYKQAIQVYERYIKEYPQTNLAGEAKYRIEIAQEAISTGFLKSYKPVDEIIKSEVSGEGFETITQTVDISTTQENIHSPLGIRECMDKYYKAQGFCTAKDFTNAEKELKNFFASLSPNINPEMIEEAKILYFNVLFNLKKFSECSQEITEFIKNSNKPLQIKKALFILADIYKELEKPELEKGILQKILTMVPVDDLTRKAKERISQLG
ncbi:MAG: cyclic nucleotide-binding domain-containing protein [Brevinematia bacterium]